MIQNKRQFAGRVDGWRSTKQRGIRGSHPKRQRRGLIVVRIAERTVSHIIRLVGWAKNHVGDIDLLRDLQSSAGVFINRHIGPVDKCWLIIHGPNIDFDCASRSCRSFKIKRRESIEIRSRCVGQSSIDVDDDRTIRRWRREQILNRRTIDSSIDHKLPVFVQGHVQRIAVIPCDR